MSMTLIVVGESFMRTLTQYVSVDYEDRLVYFANLEAW